MSEQYRSGCTDRLEWWARLLEKLTTLSLKARGKMPIWGFGLRGWAWEDGYCKIGLSHDWFVHEVGFRTDCCSSPHPAQPSRWTSASRGRERRPSWSPCRWPGTPASPRSTATTWSSQQGGVSGCRTWWSWTTWWSKALTFCNRLLSYLMMLWH